MEDSTAQVTVYLASSESYTSTLVVISLLSESAILNSHYNDSDYVYSNEAVNKFSVDMVGGLFFMIPNVYS